MYVFLPSQYVDLPNTYCGDSVLTDLGLDGIGSTNIPGQGRFCVCKAGSAPKPRDMESGADTFQK